ncbi:hypothetical protein WR25_07448 [Diploscapter pachys]|uniref:BZIP domain-containing protein n=1 Tax=Diploscapter pachys TaxID=2018661 RepID=A0A2A2JTJ5_9BILA|nr:hypothetical protein WR25_07448 [Diploscapter pachys]
MEDEWQDVLQKDCLFSSATLAPQSEQLTLTLLDSDVTISTLELKSEPNEDMSDYHGSTSGSPTSTLSSADYKEPLGLDLSLCGPFASSLSTSTVLGINSFSPASSSPFPSSMYASLHGPCSGPVPVSISATSPLPPVSHFSQQFQHQQAYFIHSVDAFERSPSPPSDRSSPMNVSPYDAIPGTLHSSNLLHNGGGPIHSHPLKIRSKMHEMAVKQKLITDQDPRGEGQVHLSPEEKRTLIQEGFSVPTRLPLTKAEEEALKMIRRKIKNKLSAQESRRKRKEYMDSLEARCAAYHNENAQLKARLRYLENLNKQLMDRYMEESSESGADKSIDSADA